MSRIFEALQKSELEKVASSFASTPLANEILEAGERESVETALVRAGAFAPLPLSVPYGSHLVAITQKESLAAEKFRYLGVKLRQMQQSRTLKKILVASTLPEEGKSMVSANLAATLARRQQQRVLLIEGDLRRPVLAQR